MLLDILFSNDLDWHSVFAAIISAVIVIFLTMPVHEFAHAFAATKLGDPTPKYRHRLTLNPFDHIDYLGALCILLFGFGWAKPVGVNPRNFDNPKVGMAITAFAGPFSNIIIAFAFSFVFYGVLQFFPTVILGSAAWYILTIISWIVEINVSLAVFNLLPVPPLDGSRLLGVILPDRIYYKIMQYEQYIYYGVLLLIVVGAFDLPMAFLTGKLINVIVFLPELIFS